MPNENCQNSSPTQPVFEQALVELEAIVRALEEGDVGLAEALARYEQGVGLLKQCYALLERAERRIELLCGQDAEGNPVTEPFDDEATLSLEEKAQVRSSRRSQAGAKTPRKAAKTPVEQSVQDVDESGGLF